MYSIVKDFVLWALSLLISVLYNVQYFVHISRLSVTDEIVNYHANVQAYRVIVRHVRVQQSACIRSWYFHEKLSLKLLLTK
jgi:hypothetical protein